MKGAFVYRRTCLNIAEAFVGVFNWLFLNLNTKEFYLGTLFATRTIEWLHFEAALPWRYLSELFVTSYVRAGKFKRMSPKISL